MSKYVTGLLLVIILLLAGCAAPARPCRTRRRSGGSHERGHWEASR